MLQFIRFILLTLKYRDGLLLGILPIFISNFVNYLNDFSSLHTALIIIAN